MKKHAAVLALVVALCQPAPAVDPVQADAARLDDEALAKLPVKERVAVLIKRLPEQTGRQMLSRGWCDIFAMDHAFYRLYTWMPGNVGRPRESFSPAGKLYQIGLDAVPLLLDALDDPRPTQAVGFGRAALDVGDCAMQILQRLSGRSFHPKGDYPPSQVAIRAEMKRNAEAWWKEVVNSSEADVLDKDISAGRGEGSAERLAEIAPDRVVGAIERGLANAEDQYAASSLLLPLVTIEREPSRALLSKVVTQGRFLRVRMQAAEYVCEGETTFNGRKVKPFPEEDRRMAREAMLKEWKDIPDVTKGRDNPEAHNFAEFLGQLAAKEVALLPAIRAELPRHTPKIRAAVITGLGQHLPLLPRTSAPKVPWLQSAPDLVIERFLAAMLEDEEYTPEIKRIESARPQHRTARVADIAADFLHKLRPLHYSFAWNAEPDAMERSRLGCLGAWRKLEGLPDEASAAHAPPERIHPTAVVSIGMDSEALPPALKSEVDAWLWKPLNADALAQFLVDFAHENSDDSRTISLTASRSAGKAGVEIEIEVRTEHPPAAKRNSRVDVVVGGKALLRESSDVGIQGAKDLHRYSLFKLRVAEALAAPADTALFIQFVRLGQPLVKP